MKLTHSQWLFYVQIMKYKKEIFKNNPHSQLCLRKIKCLGNSLTKEVNTKTPIQRRLYKDNYKAVLKEIKEGDQREITV